MDVKINREKKLQEKIHKAYTASSAAKKFLKEAKAVKLEEISLESRPELLEKLEKELVEIIVKEDQLVDIEKENNNEKRLRAILAIIAVEKEGDEKEAMKKLELEIAEVKKEKYTAPS